MRSLDRSDLLRIRDHAILLLDFAGAFCRSELVALDFDHIAEHRDGLVVTLEWSKTDQEGTGNVKGLPYGAHAKICPVRGIQDWFAVSAISEGPLFRPINWWSTIGETRLSDKAIVDIIKRTVTTARDQAVTDGNTVFAELFNPKYYAGHSLRSGFVTSAAAAGVSTHDIMRQTHHKREETLQKYIRHATVFRQNAAAQVGLTIESKVGY